MNDLMAYIRQMETDEVLDFVRILFVPHVKVAAYLLKMPLKSNGEAVLTIDGTKTTNSILSAQAEVSTLIRWLRPAGPDCCVWCLHRGVPNKATVLGPSKTPRGRSLFGANPSLVVPTRSIQGNQTE